MRKVCFHHSISKNVLKEIEDHYNSYISNFYNKSIYSGNTIKHPYAHKHFSSNKCPICARTDVCKGGKKIVFMTRSQKNKLLIEENS